MYMRKKASIIGNKIGIHVEALVVVQAYHSVAANLIGIMHKLCLWIIRQISDKLIFDENKCSLDDVKKAIAKVGHDTDTILATDEDYNTLHHCCLYKSEE